MKTSVTMLSSYLAIHACHKAFASYHVILEEKKNTVQGTLDQILTKQHIKQQQPESAVDADNSQPSTSMM